MRIYHKALLLSFWGAVAANLALAQDEPKPIARIEAEMPSFMPANRDTLTINSVFRSKAQYEYAGAIRRSETVTHRAFEFDEYLQAERFLGPAHYIALTDTFISSIDGVSNTEVINLNTPEQTSTLASSIIAPIIGKKFNLYLRQHGEAFSTLYYKEPFNNIGAKESKDKLFKKGFLAKVKRDAERLVGEQTTFNFINQAGVIPHSIKLNNITPTNQTAYSICFTNGEINMAWKLVSADSKTIVIKGTGKPVKHYNEELFSFAVSRDLSVAAPVDMVKFSGEATIDRATGKVIYAKYSMHVNTVCFLLAGNGTKTETHFLLDYSADHEVKVK